MNKVIAYIRGKEFLKNVLLAVGIILLLLIVLNIWLKIYTHHARSIAVPDFSDLPIESAAKEIDKRNLRYEIFDSIFIPTKDRGVVVDQHPRPGFLVKKDRKIYFTINANQPEKTTMPELVGVTFREAEIKIRASGLIVGNITYRYDMAKNVVLEQLVDENPMETGDTVFRGTRIDLVLGKGLANEKSMVPDLIGLTVEEAKLKAIGEFFSIGTVIPDQSVEENEVDTLVPHIFRQHPGHNPDVRVSLGTQITLWITIDSLKLYKQKPDSSVVWDELKEGDYTEDVEDDSYDDIFN